MKLEEAQKIIDETPSGFMVAFEWIEGSNLRKDYFPDVTSGEPAIQSEVEAWGLARQFADATRGKCINVHVILRSDFKPVLGYRERMIENR